MSDEASVSPGRLVLVPAVITLGVTLLRLFGELQGWSPRLFSREPGGGGALVGISWLVPLFGAWFGWKVARAGAVPARLGRALGLTFLAIVLMPALGFAAHAAGLAEVGLGTVLLYVVGSIVGVLLGWRAWPALGRTLLAYAFAARVPVALIMLFAILGSWGTHYDALPPGLPPMAPLPKWLLIGLLPQMTVWIWFTVVVGGLFGLGAAALARRRAPATA
jgi:hypothetical protein